MILKHFRESDVSTENFIRFVSVFFENNRKERETPLFSQDLLQKLV